MSPIDQIEHYFGVRASDLNRREFLTLMGASIALAGLSGCRNKLPAEEIFAYSKRSTDETLSKQQYFATTFPMPGFVQGLLVESHEGHPTKIEGNPNHPASLGATGLFAQASILDLYSPSRLKKPRIRLPDGKTEVRDWLQFRSALIADLKQYKESGGEGLAIVSGEVVSPTLRSQLTEIQTHYPKSFLCISEPIEPTNSANFLVNFAKTKRILAIDCDFLGYERNAVANAANYVNSRRQKGSEVRLYVAESSVSITGTKADHRWALDTSDYSDFLNQIELGLSNKKNISKDVAALVEDLKAHEGESVIIGGFALPPRLHAKIYHLNRALGNLNSTIKYFVGPNEKRNSLQALNERIMSDSVKTLIILGGNPVYHSVADVDFKSSMAKVPTTIHLTQFPNETTALTHWSLPESHFLESWSDAESYDGTQSLVQPLLTPLHDSVSAHDVLNWLIQKNESGYETVRNYWRSKIGENFESEWRAALQLGIWPGKYQQKRAIVSNESVESTPPNLGSPANNSKNGLEIIFRPDPTVWDGRYSENVWLQELPKPPTQLTWDNALLISSKLASAKKISTGDIVRLKTPTGELESAAFVQEGLPENTLQLSIGYGRKGGDSISSGAGFNANVLRSAKNPWRSDVIAIEKTGGRYDLACTHVHHSMEQRDLIRSVSPLGAQENDSVTHDKKDFGLDIGRGSLGPHIPLAMENAKEQWAMSIDTDACIGCSVCVIACQAENNIPVVGKEMVLRGREMHWIRIDRYSTSNRSTPSPLPVTCMHCETAPCEVVCPVGATSHSSNGLNQMVYNRCVGTRYCSNNCPYKVRRFNFFKFSDNTNDYAEQRNPDVTVRSRGVMEKCTYCVQRIERARIEASKELREIRDGEIQTACQQACPTDAIQFGNLKDPNSAIQKFKSTSRTYGLLTDLGTRPRTTYLAQITNPNPAIGSPV